MQSGQIGMCQGLFGRVAFFWVEDQKVLQNRADGIFQEEAHAQPGDYTRHLSWKVRSARDRAIRTFHIRVRSKFFQNSGIFARKFKTFGNFQHVLKYRRNSDKISSKSEQKSMKQLKKNEFLQNFTEKCEKV